MVRRRRRALVVLAAVAAESECECRWKTGRGCGASGLELEATLLRDYDLTVRPEVSKRNSLDAPPDNVTIELSMLSFAINEIDQTLTARGYFRLFWHDDRLAHESPWADDRCAPGSTERAWSLSNQSSIWRPDIYSENFRQSNVRPEDTASLTWIYPDGMVFTSRYINAVFECSFKARQLPFDSHTCSVEIGSYSLTKDDLILTALGDGIPYEIARGNSIWQLDKTSATNVDYTYPAGVWSYAILQIHVTRRSKYHINYSMIPALIFLAIVYCGFFVDRASAPARVGVSITSVLILRLLLNAVFSQMETVSYEIYITQFLQISLIYGCLSVFQYALVQHYMHEEEIAASRRRTLEKLQARVNTRIEKSIEMHIKESKGSDDIFQEVAIVDDTDDDYLWDPPGPCNPIWERDMHSMKALFDRFDSDGSGTIEALEVSNLLRYYGLFVDVEHASDLILNWLFINKYPIPQDIANVSLNFPQFQDFLVNYPKYSLGEADTKNFFFQPRSLQCDVVCRYFWFPAIGLTYLVHWIFWFG
ncbi:hypothetical protein CTAYLR_001369 [Chrysophaeum taylorii]|uniref:EF-hand domain-containing protein n=1 Tax=Chrysophaeum taylorii TaxID=2483200 RepID=A0AAD7XHF9_9STRA|nr:hypothetical protein CTAYLR_001369 [Chrysophaeum taylorii]